MALSQEDIQFHEDGDDLYWAFIERHMRWLRHVKPSWSQEERYVWSKRMWYDHTSAIGA